MTSECFVYIVLPGSTEFVTAGKYRISSRPGATPVGRFIYGRRYLERTDRVEIDPVELRLRADEYMTARLNANFGALRDASPDAWGRRLIEKRLGNPDPSELDYLLASPDDRAGALGFGLGVAPPAPKRQFNRTIELAPLIELADLISESARDSPLLRGDPDAEQVDALLRAGTSMGGARPKATIEDGEGLWLAKFPKKDDTWNNPRVEHAMLRLAHECGLSAAESRIESVGGRDVLLVKRFDRHKTPQGYLRSRMISAMTLLGADDTMDWSKWSYLLLADEVRRRADSAHEHGLPELFKRMCFNALISNVDDHPRNHALIAKDHGWRLSPAYDLTPTLLIATERRDLAMACGQHGRYANRANLLSASDRFRLARPQAEAIVDEMTETVSKRWYAIARSVGVEERDCETIKSAFVYEGFRFEPYPEPEDRLRALRGRHINYSF